MVKINHLSKSYDAVKAVDDISLDIEDGEIFGFLGPNGAGFSSILTHIAALSGFTLFFLILAVKFFKVRQHT